MRVLLVARTTTTTILSSVAQKTTSSSSSVSAAARAAPSTTTTTALSALKNQKRSTTVIARASFASSSSTTARMAPSLSTTTTTTTTKAGMPLSFMQQPVFRQRHNCARDDTDEIGGVRSSGGDYCCRSFFSSPSTSSISTASTASISSGSGSSSNDSSFSAAASTSVGSGSTSTTTTLSSSRGRDAVKLLPSYLADARAVSKYCPRSNPDGALQLGVAESQLMSEDWLLPALRRRQDEERDVLLQTDAIYYQPTAGRSDLREEFVEYMENLLLDRDAKDSIKLDPEHLIVGAGCNAVLENLCFSLAEPGQAVLIPTPYYAAFEFDLVARIQLHVQPVTTESFHHPRLDVATAASAAASSSSSPHLDPSIYYPTAAALDAAYERAAERGHEPRILLLSHPQNPLGICYPPEVLRECVDWCRNRRVHLISDEIYAASVHGGPDVAGFTSIFNVAAQLRAEEEEEDYSSPFTSSSSSGGGSGSVSLSLGPYVHWVYALSKDFAISGMRVGACYTDNEQILLPLQKLNDLCQISSATQCWTRDFLRRKINENEEEEEELWVNAYMRENHRRLRARSRALVDCLRECGIPYLEPTAGLFCWIDLTEFLTNDDDADAASHRESVLYKRLVHEFGLLLTPGLSMRCERPGFFRCVFTAANDQEFRICLQRIRKFVNVMRKEKEEEEEKNKQQEQ